MNALPVPLLTAVLILSACSGVPERRVPAEITAAVPTSYPPSVGQRSTATLADDWWTAFGDPALSAWMTRGLAYNSDLSIAAARVLEAGALARQAGADRLPQLGAFLGATRQRALLPQGGVPASAVSERGQVGVSASWELDLWGRLALQDAAARRRYLAEGYTLTAVRLSVTAELVRGYLQVQTLDAQRQVLQDNRALLSESLALNERRYQLGSISELDVQRARAELADTEAQLADITRSLRISERALTVLAGDWPAEALPRPVAPLDELPELPPVPVGLPAALLDRRPDLRAAEALLQAQQADVGAARRALLPTVSLSGRFGGASPDLSALLRDPLTIWSVGADLLQVVFDGGRRRAGIAGAEARATQALERYARAARGAYGEVLDALETRRAAAAVRDARSRQAAALAVAERLAQRRYEEGYSAYLELLDARRSRLQARLAVAQARSAEVDAYVRLITALGGGWQAADIDRLQ